MDIEVITGKEVSHAVATFHYHRNPDSARITIMKHTCPGCGEDMLTQYDYCNILNHEYLEIFAIKTILEDYPGYKWNRVWWDDRIEYFMGHMAWHEHEDLLYSLDYG